MTISSRVPFLFQIHLFAVLTGSMEPAIPSGSLIIVRPTGHYKTGDIITYRIGSSLVTHRVVDVLTDKVQQQFLTQGDANRVADDYLVWQKDIVGVVLFHIPFMGRGLKWIQSPGGVLVTMATVAVIMIEEFTGVIRNATWYKDKKRRS